MRAYLGYELSPSPNVAKFTPFKYVGGSFFSNSAFQNARAFAGRSPCPVVDTTKIVRVYECSTSYAPESVSDQCLLRCSWLVSLYSPGLTDSTRIHVLQIAAARPGHPIPRPLLARCRSRCHRERALTLFGRGSVRPCCTGESTRARVCAPLQNIQKWAAGPISLADVIRTDIAQVPSCSYEYTSIASKKDGLYVSFLIQIELETGFLELSCQKCAAVERTKD